MMTKWCTYKDGELRRWWTFHGAKCVQAFTTHIIQQDCNESWYEWYPDSLIVINDREFFIQEEHGWYHFKREDI